MILWAWKGSNRLHPALFEDKEISPKFISEFKKAMCLNIDKDDYYDKFKCYYLKASFKLIGANLYRTKIDGTNHYKMLDMLFSCHYKIHLYIKGYICNSIPLPNNNMGRIDEERIITSPRVKETLNELKKIWENPKSNIIYVSGAPGAGKEGYCKAIHYGKGRTGMFKTIDMTNQNEAQFQVQMFGKKSDDGHIIKGSIEDAELGTLFLDEINKSNYDIRSQLLRPFESREYYPYNSSYPQKYSDVNFILASPDKLSLLKRNCKDKNGDHKNGPIDLWTRVNTEIVIKHPFDIVEKNNIRKVVEDFFCLFWINAFHSIINYKKQDINKILLKIHSNMDDHETQCQPHEHSLASYWVQYVYDIIVKDDDKKYIDIKIADLFDYAKDLFPKLLMSLIGTRNLADISIREFKHTINNIANFAFNSFNSNEYLLSDNFKTDLENEIKKQIKNRFSKKASLSTKASLFKFLKHS